MKKIVTVTLSLVLANFMLIVSGFPRFGTFGFLLLINAIHALLLYGYYVNNLHERTTWARAASLVAILLAVLALFRGNPYTQDILGASSLIMTLIAYYLFGLNRGSISGIFELAFLPILVIWSAAKSVWVFVVEHQTKWHVASLIAIPSVGVVSLILAYFLVENVTLRDFFQFVGFNGLVLPLLVLLFCVKMSNPVKERFDVRLFHQATTEMTILCLLCLIILASYIVVTWKELFLIASSLDLVSAGYESLSQYVRDGFVKLAVVTAASYLLITLAYMSANQEEDDTVWLRATAAGFLIVKTAMLGAIMMRTWWYMSVYGLTYNRFVGISLLVLVGVFNLSLIVRFLSGRFEYYRLSELVILVGYVFILGLINIDAIVARNLINKPADERDIVELASLSPDAPFAWEVAYSQATQTLVHLGQGPSSDPQYDIESLGHARDTIEEIEHHYYNLDHYYYPLRLESEIQSPEDAWNVAQAALSINLAEWSAYQYLVNQLKIEDSIYQED